MKILGREPAAYIGLIEGILGLALALGLFDLTAERNALILAAASAVLGLVVAWTVRDTLLGAIVQAAKAATALAVGYGLDWTPEQTAAAITFVTIAAGFFLRTQTSSVATAVSAPSAGSLAVGGLVQNAASPAHLRL